MSTSTSPSLEYFHPTLRDWFADTFEEPTDVQQQAWPAIAEGHHALMLAPTGSGKTLAAFLVAINRIMFPERPRKDREGVRVLYISPLKALGVDIERNLRSPLAGVRAYAERQQIEHHVPAVGVRSGDTPSQERARLVREPPDILITTPESLYLMLTSRARETLRDVDAVIIDEIHSMVATKRGAHLFVSLERLERLKRSDAQEDRAIQRVGLSATQRPLEEVARLLGGADPPLAPGGEPRPRPVRIIEAGRRKTLQLKIEVPVEDMARLGSPNVELEGPKSAAPSPASIWPSIHPRLVELIRAHRSTMLFVNSRRLAERLATAINELAEEEIALAHHGSIAKDTRRMIEDRLKRGQLPAIVATSSLELGIDMGAVDLVIQVESPPSIASGVQRIGRAGHQVGAPSKGVVFPKFRGDLLACSAAVSKMQAGEVESTFYPRNPLDVLAQQVVAMTALGSVPVDEVYDTMRCAAPFAELPRGSFDGVLDLLSGRYPSDEFAELRPRLHWDRIGGALSPRRGTQRTAVLNAGTIPDRGLYGVFLADEQGNGSRVGELDEEMVFETNPGDVFLLGASSWRVLEITHDRVLVAPAPGEPGKMPFWRGDGPGRPLEFGKAIGMLTRRLLKAPAEESQQELTEKHALDPLAAKNLVRYVNDQQEACGATPSDKQIVVECFVDEVGDWRVAILSPFGARVHAPWAMAVAARLRSESPTEVDMMWTDDGIVLRLPESDSPPPLDLLLPKSDEIEDQVVRELGSSALFAARFRENAARALLLPKHRPGGRQPLWVQRRRSADLLAVASRYPEFPILLETFRECLRDVFDLDGLKSLLQDIERRRIRVQQVETNVASPFAAALMFNYVGKFLYEGDAPLAERRAATLALDHAQLRELLGDAELRELLDADAIDELTLELQRLTSDRRVRHLDALHELLLHLGDLRADEIDARCESAAVAAGEPAKWLEELISQRRVVEIRVAGETRYAAAEDAARFRDALGVVPPLGLPEAFLQEVAEPLQDLASRYARTHGPFSVDELAVRLGLGVAPVRQALDALTAAGRLLEGDFLAGRRDRQWCDSDVLRTLKRRSLAKLRREVEPVDAEVLARFFPVWQGLGRRRRGLDGLLDAIEQLQGAVLPAAALERDILPARVDDYQPGDLDELCAAGEIIWRGFEPLGSNDGRVALYLTDHFQRLAPLPEEIEEPDELCDQVRQVFTDRGAMFFEDLAKHVEVFNHDLLAAVWRLVWQGELTNDTIAPLRSLRSSKTTSRRNRGSRQRHRFRSRRQAKLASSEGRWSLLETPTADWPTTTERQTATTTQLLQRYGVLTREMVLSEGVSGGFASLYPILKAMEETGRLRRGYFVAGLGAAQFAMPGADDQLRDLRRPDDDQPRVQVLAATDPANPYGLALKWPERTRDDAARPGRAAGARVILLEGRLIGYLGRTGESLLTFFADSHPQLEAQRNALVEALGKLADREGTVMLNRIDGGSPFEADEELRAAMLSAGFLTTGQGLLRRSDLSARSDSSAK